MTPQDIVIDTPQPPRYQPAGYLPSREPLAQYPPSREPLAQYPFGPRRRRARRRRRAIVSVITLALAVVAWHAPGVLRAGLDVRAVADAMPWAADDGSPGPAADVVPVATGLDPELQRRFDVAQAAAGAEGVELTITSGWRSAQEQQAIVDKAVEQYGSTQEAHRWVLPPELSAHVAGLAVDVRPTEGAYWLTENGLEYGLCRTYVNEVWHFEPLAAGAATCPEPDADSSWGW